VRKEDPKEPGAGVELDDEVAREGEPFFERSRSSQQPAA
jgi:hypothetical protein